MVGNNFHDLKNIDLVSDFNMIPSVYKSVSFTHRAFDCQILPTVDCSSYSNEVLGPGLGAHCLQSHAIETIDELILSKLISNQSKTCDAPF